MEETGNNIPPKLPSAPSPAKTSPSYSYDGSDSRNNTRSPSMTSSAWEAKDHDDGTAGTTTVTAAATAPAGKRNCHWFLHCKFFLCLVALAVMTVAALIFLTAKTDSPILGGLHAKLTSPDGVVVVSTNAPTVQRTPIPTNKPTTISSLRPSIAISASPSVVVIPPTTPPTIAPVTMMPSVAPSTLSPTMATIPKGFNFRMRMYWREEFYWQEEWDERRWCVECTKCKALTTSGMAEGCGDIDGSNGGDCRAGDQLWIQKCDDFGGSGNVHFEVVRDSTAGADQFKIQGQDLCMTLVAGSDRYINVQTCDVTNVRQFFTGFGLAGPFIVYPYQQNPDGVERCLTQHHHPKAGEVLFLDACATATFWDTAYWEAI
jgi:hypothetical protein